MVLAAAVAIVCSLVSLNVLSGSPALPATLAFVVVCAIAIPLDLRAKRLPRQVVGVGLLVVLGAQVGAAWAIDDPQRVAWVIGGALLGWVLIVAAHSLAPNGAGFGDAAFAALASCVLGWYGPGRVVLGIGLGIVIAAVAAGPVTLAARRDLLTLSPGVSLRPALAVGTWLAMCWGETIVAAY